MEEGVGPVTTVLRSVLDMYKDAAVAVVGCHAAGTQRESCELDVVVVTDETRPYSAVKFGNRFFDLYFVTRKEALNPADAEVAMSLARAKPVRDADLVLSTSLVSNQAMMSGNSKKCASLRLASCLKALARTEESLIEERIRAANYWLLSASYDFARSWLYGQESIPSPSHMLKQLKEHSKGSSMNLEAFLRGAGLQRSSRRECAARLEAVSVVYDIIGSHRTGDCAFEPFVSETSCQVVKAKAAQMAEAMEHAESYSFLGSEVVRVLLAVARAGRQQADRADDGVDVADVLSEGEHGLLGDSLVHDLGLQRSKIEVEGALTTIRGQVAKLARRV
jgi:hypothetical protein